MNHATPTKNAVITIHKITHHTVLSDRKTPHDFMTSSSNAALRRKTLAEPDDADLCRADVRRGKMPGRPLYSRLLKRARTCAPDCAKRNRAGEDRARSLSLTTY